MSSVQVVPTLRAALAYAQRGWKVFPLHSIKRDGTCTCGDRCGGKNRGKHPILPRGFHVATTDEAWINAAWNRFPFANVGIACKRSGLLVLDIDERNDGFRTLQTLTEKAGHLPPTYTVLTGSDPPGEHYYYTAPKELIPPGSLGPGVDVKWDGYVVAPPSIHADGGHYETADPDAEVAAIGNWLDKISIISDGLGTEEQDFTEENWSVEEGSRHMARAAIAGTLRQYLAFNEDEIAETLEVLDERFEGIEPDRTSDIRRVARDAAQWRPGRVPWQYRFPAEADLHKRDKIHTPDPIDDDAFIGVAGEFVDLYEPYTEASEEAMLVQFLALFGNLLGRTAYVAANDGQHYANIYTVIAGSTARARKGTALAHVKRLMTMVDPSMDKRIMSGFSSAEALVDYLAGGTPTNEKAKVNGKMVRAQRSELKDKRVVIVEQEFSSLIRRMNRENNVTSQQLRTAWDAGHLERHVVDRHQRVEDVHLSVIGHMTQYELTKELNMVDIFNGWANRFLWIYASRTKLLPMPPRLEGERLTPIVEEVRESIRWIKQQCDPGGRLLVELTRDAREMWEDFYHEVEDADYYSSQSLDALAARMAPVVQRVAMIYAMLDRSRTIKVDHLLAAIAVWDYSLDSAEFLFQDLSQEIEEAQKLKKINKKKSKLPKAQKKGLALEDRLLHIVQQNYPTTCGKSFLMQKTSRNYKAKEIETAMAMLVRIGKVEEVETGRGKQRGWRLLTTE